ncbi:MAG: hypothetical protein VB957_10745 [Pseudomonadales bacterium]
MYKIFFLVSVLLMTACQSSSQSGDVPAIIAEPTIESRAELVRVISSALKIDTVTLLAAAFTNTSGLIVERKRANNLQGRIGNGREMQRPDHFTLVINGAICILLHLESEQRYQLIETVCKSG